MASKLAKKGRKAGKGKQTTYVGFRTALSDEVALKKLAKLKGKKPSEVYRAAFKVALEKPKSLAAAVAAA